MSSSNCKGQLQPSVTLQIATGATPTFTVVVVANGVVVLDPANNRAFIRYKDPGGTTRGSSSVAVTTQ